MQWLTQGHPCQGNSWHTRKEIRNQSNKTFSRQENIHRCIQSLAHEADLAEAVIFILVERVDREVVQAADTDPT